MTTLGLIRKHSPFSLQKTEELITSHFLSVSPQVQICLKNHNFGHLKVLDIASGFGNSLMYWGKNSEGIEIKPELIKFLSFTEKKIHQLNVEDDLGKLKGDYDAVFNMNFLEHLVAPHLFLMRVHQLLKKDGLLAISVPVVPSSLINLFWKTYTGYEAWSSGEHINFYNPRTLALTLSRAGFKIVKQYNPAFRLSHFSPLFLASDCLTICQKISQFKYPGKRQIIFEPHWAADLKKFHP